MIAALLPRLVIWLWFFAALLAGRKGAKGTAVELNRALSGVRRAAAASGRAGTISANRAPPAGRPSASPTG